MISTRLKGSLGWTKIGLLSSNHWSMDAKSILTRPASSLAGPERSEEKAKTLSMERSETERIHCLASGFPESSLYVSPSLILRAELVNSEAGM